VDVSNPFLKKLTPSEQQAKLIEDSRARQESERRWYAALPTKVILSLCTTVAVLTYLLSVAPQAAQRPQLQEKAAPTAPVAPAPPPGASRPTSVKMRLSSKALFAYNSSVLKATEASAQRELDACLKPKLTGVHVVGHADCIGSDAYNQILSERRAAAIKRYLTGKGIDAALVTTEGRGAVIAKTDPLCTKVTRSTEANVARLEQYRRVDVTCDDTQQDIQVQA
jgi:outer membrane protein OmpA-like peptidoglycan-associated protein